VFEGGTTSPGVELASGALEVLLAAVEILAH
jgi:hypothetical protein